MATKAELNAQINRLQIDADLREHDLEVARRALREFQRYDGDEDLWGELVKQRDKALAALAFVLDTAKANRDLTASKSDRNAWREVVEFSYRALGSPSATDIEEIKSRAV